MGAKNKVVAGDYAGAMISSSFGETRIIIGFGKTIVIDKYSIETYEVVDEDYKKSTSSAVGRALVGSLFGGVGMLVGIATAKSKGVHTIALLFKDGKKSLIGVDDKIYKNIMKAVF